GVACLHCVAELDVRELLPPDDGLLGLDRLGVPCPEVVQVLLHDHVTAAGEARILLADDRRLDRALIGRVLGSVDETEEIALVEELEAVHLVDDGGRVAQLLDELSRQLEAEIHAPGANVEENVSGCGHGEVLSPDLLEGMQLLRPWLAEE